MNPKPKKSLGQNFLKSPEVLNEIIQAVEINEQDKILEIGPGNGFLTLELAQKAQKVLAIEKDEALAENLEKRINSELDNKSFTKMDEQRVATHCSKEKKDKIKIIKNDFLKVNLAEILQENDFLDYKIVANLPYYITGKIIRQILEAEFPSKICVLMLQKEVAERITARPPKMNFLALAVRYFGRPKFIAKVGKENFWPVPKVDSAIIRIDLLDEKSRPKKENWKRFFQLTKIAFASPRKTLLNNLSVGLKLEKEKTLKILEKLGWNEKTRAQELDLDEWGKLIDIM